MQQSALWHDLITDAVGTAVLAAGGMKRVATKLWPTLDASVAAARLRSALNPEQPQKLDPLELVAIARLAKSGGDHSIMTYLGRELGYEIAPLSSDEAKTQAIKAERKALLERLQQLDEE